MVGYSTELLSSNTTSKACVSASTLLPSFGLMDLTSTIHGVTLCADSIAPELTNEFPAVVHWSVNSLTMNPTSSIIQSPQFVLPVI